MDKTRLFSIIRSILTALGAFLLGQHVFGQTIDQPLWEGIVGAIIALGSAVWGIVDKTATIEMVQSGLRSVILVIGGLLVAAGKIKAEVLTSILGIISFIVPLIYGKLSTDKNKAIASGKISVLELKRGNEKTP